MAETAFRISYIAYTGLNKTNVKSNGIAFVKAVKVKQCTLGEGIANRKKIARIHIGH